MSETRKVIKKHFPPARDDISLAVGDKVTIGTEDTGNPNWKNWVWCSSKVTNKSGWVPKQYLQIKNQTGTTIKKYSSVELAVSEGDILEVVYYLNGWGWCVDSSGTQGWVPDENLA